MKNKGILIGIVVLIAIVLVAAAAWFFVLGDTEEASAPISSEPVAVTEASGGSTVFEIVQAESEARFMLGELLRGEPTTVIGVTDQVAGEIAVDPNDPARTQVGVIKINARTLATDSDMRNRAIGNRILQTGDYEFITFTPTSISGMPASVAVGESFSFQVTGSLTIRDISHETTFEVTVTPASEMRLEGLATATIARADYNLTIPNVPSVADVDEEVLLELEFVATAGN